MMVRPDDFASADGEFEDFMRREAPSLHAHVRWVYPDVDADHTVNDTFFVAWRRRGDAELNTQWLRGIAHGVVRNARRSSNRWHRLLHRSHRLNPPALAPAVDHPDAIEFRLAVRALSRLSQSDAELIRLTAYDLPSDEIAELLGISHEAARQRLSRARRRLLAEYEHEQHHPEREAGA